jgi:hypothetical protein
VLELLLSQERVISLLYDRALPPRMSFGGFGGIANIVTAGEWNACFLQCFFFFFSFVCVTHFVYVADEEEQVRELLEKLPGEGFAETDGWLLEDGNDSASP